MGRYDLTDAQYALLEAELPTNDGKTGHPWGAHRPLINGIFWRLHTGAPWRDIPERYGNWTTIYDRYTWWRRDGTWDRIVRALQRKLDAAGQIDWNQWSLDGTIVRAHRAAAGAPHDPVDGADEPVNHALGRSVGGFSTKIHLLSDSTGVPLDALLTPGQTHESTQLEAVLEQADIPRTTPRRRRKPRRLSADRAYDAQRIRHFLRRHGIQPIIPPRRRRGKPKRGRPVTYDRVAYRKRSTIEQCVGWLKECRAVATRYEKLALNYLGLVKLAFIERYLRLLTRLAPAS
jgi:transposase